jgi:Ca-activated chloride channel homolog
VRDGRYLLYKILILALFLLLGSAALAQSGRSSKEQSKETGNEDAIKVDATLVDVPIVASDKQGKYIPGLRAEDFILYEDGIRQEVEFFSSETVPFHVVLLLDTSSSTRQRLVAIQDAARQFISNLRNNDQVMIISFATDITVENRFTSDRAALSQAIRSVTPGGSTRLYDAVLLAARNVLKKKEGRKALIVLTDGNDTGSYMHAKYAISETIESGALVYVVRYPRSKMPSTQNYSNHVSPSGKFAAQYPYPYDYNFVGELIDKTDGTLFDATSIYNLAGPMRNIAEELRHVYSIGYYPLNPVQNGGYRKIELKLREHPSVALRYKKGYNAANLVKTNSNSK